MLRVRVEPQPLPSERNRVGMVLDRGAPVVIMAESGRDREAVAKAVRLIEQSEEAPNLTDLAAGSTGE